MINNGETWEEMRKRSPLEYAATFPGEIGYETGKQARAELKQLRERATELAEYSRELEESVKTLHAEVAQLTEQLAEACNLAHDPRVTIEIRDPRWSDDGT